MAKPTDLPEWDTTQVNAIEPTTERKEQGWLAPAGVPEKPPFQTFNYWQNEVYRWLKAINDQGILEYDNLTDYTANLSYAVGSDGILYVCKINNGPSSSVVDPVGDLTGTWVIQSATPQNNLLVNPEMLINQDAFAGGALVAGNYGYDMWKASTGGADVSASSGVITLSSGGIEQSIESPGLASKLVALSANITSGTLSYDIEGVTGSLGGSGVQIVYISIPGGSTGDILVKLSGTCVFSELSLQPNNYSKFIRRAYDEEISKCYRNYFKSLTDEFEILSVASATQVTTQKVTLPVAMRAVPTVTPIKTSGSAGLGTPSAISTEAYQINFTGNANAIISWSWTADARP